MIVSFDSIMAAREPHRPPFEVTGGILASCASIMRLVGRYEGLSSPPPQPKLRRQNRVRTVHATLRIEGNALSTDHVTAVLDGKRVVGERREILEITNALAAYDAARGADPAKEPALLGAHRTLMNGLVEDAGRYRQRSVGVLQGTKVAHVAPQAKQVPALVRQLLEFVGRDVATHPLIRAAAAHYEIEFIHPFTDGNGRMGRLWQHVILTRYAPVFEYVPVESIIEQRQAEYYRVLGECDRAGSSTTFIAFVLDALDEALGQFVEELRPAAATALTRLDRARSRLGATRFSRKEYLALFKTISTATASRDLQAGVADGTLVRRGNRAQARYRFVGGLRARR